MRKTPPSHEICEHNYIWDRFKALLQTDFLFFDMNFGYVVLRTILQNFLVRIVDLLCSCKDMGLQTLPFASVNTPLQTTKGKLFLGV